jgi:hypothetical protein
MLSLLITSSLAVLTFIFLVKQHQINKTHLKIAAYDKRIKIYNAVKDFIDHIIAGERADPSLTREFNVQIKEASFLFSEAVSFTANSA